MTKLHSKRKQADALQFAANAIGATAAVYLLVAGVLRMLAGWFVTVFHQNATLQNPVSVPVGVVWLLNLLIAFGSLFAAYIFLRGVIPQKVMPILHFFPVQEKKLWLFLPVFLGVGVAVNALTSALQMRLEQNAGYTSPAPTVLPDGFWPMLLAFFALCICPAVLEELLCRGLMQGVLQHWGVWMSILITSLVFTLLHGDLVQMPGIFLLSVLLGITAYQTHSLLPGMVLHLGNNIIAFLLLYINQKVDGVSAAMLAGYLVVVLGIAACCCFGAVLQHKVYRALRPLPKIRTEQKGKHVLRRVATAPFFAITIGYLAVYAIVTFYAQ